MAASLGKRRRLRGKQPGGAAADDPAAKFAELAAAEELAHPDVRFATTGLRRKHVHWTHGRSGNPAHVQPSEMTRQQFWAHLAKVHLALAIENVMRCQAGRAPCKLSKRGVSLNEPTFESGRPSVDLRK